MQKAFTKLTKILLLFAITMVSCKKQQVNFNSENSLVQLENQFFEIQTIEDTDIKNFALAIKERNEKEHFLDKFVKKNGYILWNRSEKLVTPNGVLSYLPFRKSNENEVSGFVIARRENATNSFSFDVFTKHNLEKYGYEKRKAGKLNAKDVQLIINNFNFKIYSKTKFKITDIRLIPENQRLKLKHHLELDKLYGIIKVNDNTSYQETVFSQTGSFCFTQIVETEIWYDPDGEDDLCDCSGNEYYLYTEYEYVQVCYDAGGGGGSGGGSSSGGGGNYGGGGFGDEQEDPNMPPPNTPIGIQPPSNALIVNADDDFFEEAPADRVVNLQKMLNCFNNIPNAGATYEVKLCVDIPNNNNPDELWNMSDRAGHVFLAITKTNGIQSITQNIGFYPETTRKAASFGTTNSAIVDDGNPQKRHEFDASIIMPNISQSDFQSVLNQMILKSQEQYDLNNYNCAHFALDVLNIIRPSNSIASKPKSAWYYIPIASYDVVYFNESPAGLYHTLQKMKNNNHPEANNISLTHSQKANTSKGECN